MGRKQKGEEIEMSLKDILKSKDYVLTLEGGERLNVYVGNPGGLVRMGEPEIVLTLVRDSGEKIRVYEDGKVFVESSQDQNDMLMSAMQSLGDDEEDEIVSDVREGNQVDKSNSENYKEILIHLKWLGYVSVQDLEDIEVPVDYVDFVASNVTLPE